ncbi:uncharacterized protein LOC141595447 [Silene latifolia]|uniref:uncharacterized protein LOC141595447 n=1 Tax=Silene latifolia TaxID=37657 RepID=UPI003D7851D4
MITIKIIQTGFKLNATGSPQYSTFDTRSSGKLCTLSVCRSTSNDSNSETSPPEGDREKQELLAKIAMLQTQKYRLTDYLDERSAYLTQFAEEASAEIDAIGENALKDLDEASARIMENMEARMQELEELSDMSKEEIEKTDKELSDFEGEVESGRNEGLFFQSLGDNKPAVEMAKAKEEAKKIMDVTKQSAGSKTRRNVYLALTGIVFVGLADSYLSPSVDWRKVGVLAAIFVGLITQLIYEQKMLTESEGQGEGKEDRKE